MSLSSIFQLRQASLIPLPSLSLIMNAIRPAINLKTTAYPWIKNSDEYLWLSRSSFSLALIAQLRLIHSKQPNIKVFVPDYFCNDALTILRTLDVTIYFYQVDENLQPLKHNFEDLLKQAKPDLIIQVHYFGEPSDTSYLRLISNKYKSWFIEDSTHSITPISGNFYQGDFILYSQYKHFPIPDGALLVIRNKELICNLDLDLIIDKLDLTTTIHINKSSRIIYNMKWTIKRLVQKYFFNVQIKYFKQNQENTSHFNYTGPRISKYSLQLLDKLIANIDSNIIKQKENYKKIYEILALIGNTNIEASPRYCPYMIKYKLPANSSYDFKYFLNKKAAFGCNYPYIYWPDLPPEVLIKRDKHVNAFNHYKESIYLPIHMSISRNHIENLNALCLKYIEKQLSTTNL